MFSTCPLPSYRIWVAYHWRNSTVFRNFSDIFNNSFAKNDEHIFIMRFCGISFRKFGNFEAKPRRALRITDLVASKNKGWSNINSSYYKESRNFVKVFLSLSQEWQPHSLVNPSKRALVLSESQWKWKEGESESRSSITLIKHVTRRVCVF